MGGLSATLNSGKSSLFTNQKLIEIAGNNIANVNTPGYSRQRAEKGNLPSLEFNGFFIGQGTRIADITREHDVFITKQLQDKNATLSEENAKASPLSELENIFNISGEGLATEIDGFFDACQELTANPNGAAERAIVIQRGNLLSDAFVNTARELDKIQNDINHSLEVKLPDINMKLQDIANLNNRINAIEVSGQPANAFRDRRDQLVQELSASLGVKSYEEDNQMVTATLPGGVPLVQGATTATLNGTWVDQNLEFNVQFENTKLNIGEMNLGGEIKGLVDLRDNFIPGLQDDLDTMAYNLVQEVNTQHEAGVGLDNEVHSFFTSLADQTNASRYISVMVRDTDEIAAGATAAPGDDSNAIIISDLRDKKIIDGNDSLIQAYGQLTARVGIEASQNKLSREGAEDALIQLQNLRDGVCGVSLEEEMINLMQYQTSFEASVKLLNTVDEMMQTILINREVKDAGNHGNHV